MERFLKTKRGFSGLEAAIVLIAFVIVAAVFSSIVLNMGFFSSEKAKSTVSRGVTESSSTMTLAGNVIGKSASTANGLDEIIFRVKLGAGDTPIDLSVDKTLISYTYETGGVFNNSIYTASGELTFIGSNNGDTMLDPGETAQFDLSMVGVAASNAAKVAANKEFKLEVKPPSGAALLITRQAPAAIKGVMDLN